MKRERIVAALLWASSSLPVLAWWLRRLAEPIGIDVAAWLILPAVVRLHWRGAPRESVPVAGWAFSTAMLAASIVLRAFLPITVSAVFAVLALLPMILPPRRQGGEFAIAALAMMGLPSLMIVDLFLGLPLRFLATRLAAALVASLGFSVGVEGTGIVIDGSVFWVDVPCAGVQMLGSALLMAFVLAATFRFRFWRTVLLAASAVLLVVAANAIRIATLALGQFHGYEISSAMHRWIGIAALVPGVALLALFAMWLARRKKCPKVAAEVPRAPCASWLHVAAKSSFIAVAVAGVVRFCTATVALPDSVADDAFPCKPAEFEGEKLVELDKSEFEVNFGERFPGRIGKFRCGDRIVIIRWVTAPTHRAHSTSYCLRAAGWRIEPLPLETTERGAWSSCRAVRGDSSLTIREQVLDADGHAIPDVSDWFWRSLLSRTRGPRWIYSVVEAKNSRALEVEAKSEGRGEELEGSP